MIGHLRENDSNVIEPITAADFRAFKRFDVSAEDQLIDIFIRAARFNAEKYTNRAFVSRSFTYFLDEFPSDVITLPRSPVSAITHVKYINSANSLTTLDSADYITDLITEPARIKPVSSWPAISTNQFNCVQITFETGYSSYRQVPEVIKAALLLYTSYLFDNRDADDKGEIPRSVRAALRQFKVY